MRAIVIGAGILNLLLLPGCYNNLRVRGASDSGDGGSDITVNPETGTDVLDVITADLGDDVMCTPPETICGGTCVNTSNNLNHCGGCDRPCNFQCKAGVCSQPTQVSVGVMHACARMSDRRAYCWGANTINILGFAGQGTLGDGTSNSREIARPVLDTANNPLTNVEMISAGGLHTCLVTTDGTVYCFGSNERGQLGTGGLPSAQLYPVQVTGLPGAATHVETGTTSTCAILQDKTVWCWGANTNGQLGDGTVSDQLQPVQVKLMDGTPLTDILSVRFFDEAVCAVNGQGNVYCWGTNGVGQFGIDPTVTGMTLYPIPVQIGSGLGRVRSLDIGLGFACGAFDNSQTVCWGDNGIGQTGHPPTGRSDGGRRIYSPPETIMGFVAGVVVTGAVHACGVDIRNMVSCWGGNNTTDSELSMLTDAIGMLGDGSSTNHYMPASVQNLGAVISISAGLATTCAIQADNSRVYCWGWNNAGVTGQSPIISTSSLTPNEVVFE